MTSRRGFLLGLGGLVALTVAPAYAQVWRRVCTSTVAGGAVCSGGTVADWMQVCTSDSNCIRPAGYFLGGTSGTGGGQVAYDEIDGIDFVTEAATNPAAKLSIGTSVGGEGVNSQVRGYIYGFNWMYTVSIASDGFRFADETVFEFGAIAGAVYVDYAAVNSALRGYFAGGADTLWGPQTDTYKYYALRFTDETGYLAAAQLVQLRQGASGVSSSTKGYLGGGWCNTCGGNIAQIDGIRFDTEATINPAAGLALARAWTVPVNSSARGYFCGGQAGTGGTYAEIDGIRFDTEAAINPAAALAVARAGGGGVNSATRGYVGGGYRYVSSFYSEIDGIRFDTETAINPAASLVIARNGAAGIQSGAL